MYKQRPYERSRLSASCLCDSDDIPSFQSDRYSLSLDWGRLGVVRLTDVVHELLIKTKMAEASDGFGRIKPRHLRVKDEIVQT